MKNWGTIRPDGQIERQTNPIRITIGNPTEEQKELCAQLLGQLEIVDTPEPQYDPETQYVTDYWEEEDGKAVQKWEVHEKPAPEPDGWTEAREAYEDGVNNVWNDR